MSQLRRLQSKFFGREHGTMVHIPFLTVMRKIPCYLKKYLFCYY